MLRKTFLVALPKVSSLKKESIHQERFWGMRCDRKKRKKKRVCDTMHTPIEPNAAGTTTPHFDLSSNLNHDIIPHLHALPSKWSALWDHAGAPRGSRWQVISRHQRWPIRSQVTRAATAPPHRNPNHSASWMTVERRAYINSLNATSWFWPRGPLPTVTVPAPGVPERHGSHTRPHAYFLR